MPSILKTIKSTVKSPKKIKELLINGLSGQDQFGATDARNIEVAMTVIANHKNNTDIKGPSPWEEKLVANHHQLGHALFGVTLGMFTVGIGTTLYRKYRALSYDSYDFYLRHLKKEEFSLTTFDELKPTADPIFNQNYYLWLLEKLGLKKILNELSQQEQIKLLVYAGMFRRYNQLAGNANRTSKEQKEYAKLSIGLEHIKSILALQVAFNQQLNKLTGIHNGTYRINFASDDAIQLITVPEPYVQTKNADLSLGKREEDKLPEMPANKLTSRILRRIKELPNAIAEEYVQFSKSKVAGVYRKAWELINLQTMAFWGAWIAANFLFGLSVLGPSIALGWVVLGAASAPLVLYGLWKLGKFIYKKATGEKELTAEQPKTVAEEQTALLQTVKQKLFIERDQAHKKSIILQLRNKNSLSDNDKEIAKQSTLDSEYKGSDQVENSASYQALVGSTAGRRSKWLITGFLGLIGGFAGPQFIFWMAQTFFTTLAGTGAVAANAAVASTLKVIATTVGSPIVMLMVGIPAAIFFCLKALAKEHIAQKEHAVNVKNKLNETVEIDNKKIPKWQHFDKLLAEIKSLKNNIQTTREAIELKIKNSDKEYSAKESQQLTGAAYNLDNSDPLKHDFYDKQRHKAGIWTRVKQAAKRVFAFHGGAQTGVLVTRFLFLGTAFLASVIAGPHAVVAFFAILAVIGVVVGVSRVITYHLETRQKQRAQALEQFDSRIIFAEGEVKKLRLLNAQLKTNHEQFERDPNAKKDEKDLISNADGKPTVSLETSGAGVEAEVIAATASDRDFSKPFFGSDSDYDEASEAATASSKTNDTDISEGRLTIVDPIVLPAATISPPQSQVSSSVITTNQLVALQQAEQQAQADLPVVTRSLFANEKVGHPSASTGKNNKVANEELAHHLDRGLQQTNAIIETKKKAVDACATEILQDQPAEPIHNLPTIKVGS